MAPSNEELNRIAQEAERDLNSHQAKTGGNNSSIDDSGVDSGVTTKFPGSTVDTDVTTNVGDNRRIPPEEGGVLDDRGRATRAAHFEGVGGPEDKLAQRKQDHGGDNDNDVITSKALGEKDLVGAGKDRKGNDILDQGASASRNNVGTNPSVGGSQFKGEDYYQPEDVPGSISTGGYEAPDSVTQASRD